MAKLFLSSHWMLCAAALALAGCGSNSGASGVTTASLLDGGQAAAGDGPRIANTDPMARPIQVAWTAARAQKCGFNFNATGLRANFLAAEQRQGAQNIAQSEKTYDQTYQTISAQIAGQPDFCGEKKSALIKADLTRHLAGDFTPNLPQPKVEKPKSLFSALETDEDGKRKEPFDAGEFWRDAEARKNGQK